MKSSDLDILFVHPNASKDIYQDLSKNYSAIEPPIWCGMLANSCRRDGYFVDILDCEAEQLNTSQAVTKVLEAKPKLVVIVVYGQQPSASTQNMTGAVRLSKALDQHGVKRLYVGAHPSALPKNTVLGDKTAFVCKGEGPITIKALVNADLDDETTYANIPGLYYKSEHKKTIVGNPQAPITNNLDSEFPGIAWDLLPMDKYRTSNWHSWSNNSERAPFASLYTSLGCPYKCSFCMINAPFGTNRYRWWSPEVIIKEFDRIADMGITNVKIADELFVLNPNHFMVVCDLIIKRGHKFNIWAYSRIDTVKKVYLETLKKAGVNWLALGIESANTVVRKDVVKGGFKDVDISDIVGEIKQSGINVIGNFIVGLPEDTHETMQQTLDLALKLKCEMMNIYSAMAYPGSQLYNDALNQGLELPDEWSGYSQHSKDTKPLPSKYVSSGEVLAFRDKAFETYFNDSAYLSYVESKFGTKVVDEIKDMNSIKLERLYAH